MPDKQKKEPADVRIRIARPEDAEAIRELYAPYITDTAITFEYDVPSVEEIRQRITETLVKYPYVVAKVDDKIVGYAYAALFQPRPAYAWTAQLSIYVDQNYRREGIGTKLYYALENFLQELGYSSSTACITSSPRGENDLLKNESIRFHRKVGYNIVGKFHKVGNKFGKWYDIVWMEKKLSPRDPDPADVRLFSEWREEKEL
ncbi:MAG: N-acetyltransferase [Clostridia bacterium]|nr:N-acetyltransferase [Clostridia bacterium]